MRKAASGIIVVVVVVVVVVIIVNAIGIGKQARPSQATHLQNQLPDAPRQARTRSRTVSRVLNKVAVDLEYYLEQCWVVYENGTPGLGGLRVIE